LLWRKEKLSALYPVPVKVRRTTAMMAYVYLRHAHADALFIFVYIKCRVTYVRSQWFTAVTTSVSTRLDVLAVATTVDRAVPIQTHVPRTLRQGGLYLLAHPNLPIAALLLPQFPIIVAENYVLPANERVTDGARTRDLRSHNPPTSVSRDCPALQNRFR
jgi:hypothetical protein